MSSAEGVERWLRLLEEEAERFESQQQVIQSQQKRLESQQKTLQSQEKRIGELEEQLKSQGTRLEQLDAQLKSHKKLKGRPQLRASQLNRQQKRQEEREQSKRAGSEKVSKKKNEPKEYEERIIEPRDLPEGSRFKGYRDYDVQELKLECVKLRFRLREYISPCGKRWVGEVPPEYRQGHYGPLLVSYILYQHYQCRVPQPLIWEQLQEWDVEISTGQLSRILSESVESFHLEQQGVLKAGLETADYIQSDDTGARHQGKNGYCTVIGNEWFTYFKSGSSKSREQFLEALQGEERSYVLNEEAQNYLESHRLPQKEEKLLKFSEELLATDKENWQEYLSTLGIVSVQGVRLVSQAALLGGLIARGLNPLLPVLSDGAGQFNLLVHALCWIHAERGVRRLKPETAQQRENQAEIQELLWQYYQQLKHYKQAPTAGAKLELWHGFDGIFGRCYYQGENLKPDEPLNKVLSGFLTHKSELLRVLENPQLPLHNNGAETDIRESVIRRKISGGTRSEAGRRARDTFVGLKKTCRKLGISFWHYLISRLYKDGQVPTLAEVIRTKAAANLPAPVLT